MSFEKAREAAQKSDRAIDEFHQNLKCETWRDDKRLELLIDLDRSPEIK
ncbi:MAG TPA: hypothetical protein VK400_10105 [Pyrinomonadaceae bacterium]|nr:hypothetical protein [Pyrinomonadaceae bacterium]